MVSKWEIATQLSVLRSKIMKTGIELINEERQRQINVEGWTAEHDDRHNAGEMARAASCYAMQTVYGAIHAGTVDYLEAAPPAGFLGWPWDEEWWKPKSPVKDLVRAGALIAAEIDRLNRKYPPNE